MNNTQKDIITNEIYIEFDREKIEREGLYDYDNLVQYIDTTYKKRGFTRDLNKKILRYRNSEQGNFIRQMICFSRIKDEPAIFNNLKNWYLIDYKNEDFLHPIYCENVLATIEDNPGDF